MDLAGDERAQSIQIGAVLLFAVLIIVFSTYQAFIIPNQNRQVEFNHNQQVQRDMVEVRNTLLDTYTGGNDGYAEVTLGTTFPPRLLALNPPSPSGSLSTTAPRPIIVEDRTGTDITTEVCPGDSVDTRFLEYDPSYSSYTGAGTLRYESSFLLHDFGGETVRLAGQTLVRGNQLQIVPLTRDVSVGGTQTVAIEPRAGLVDSSEREVGDVTLPTRTSEATWERLLDGQVDPGNVTVTNGADGRNVTITLDSEFDIDCGPVGLGDTPPSGPRGGGVNDINPAAPGDIALTDSSTSNDVTTLDLNNTGGTNNITEARINFYEAQGGGNNAPADADIRLPDEGASANLQVAGQFEVLNPKITLDGQGTVTQVELAWSGGTSTNEWFILTLKLETGETGLYFVSIG